MKLSLTVQVEVAPLLIPMSQHLIIYCLYSYENILLTL